MKNIIVVFLMFSFLFAGNSQAIGQSSAIGNSYAGVWQCLCLAKRACDKLLEDRMRNMGVFCIGEPIVSACQPDVKMDPIRDGAADATIGMVSGTLATISGGSGATIMAATAGAPVIAGAGGLAGAYLINKHCFNDNSKASEAARTGTYVGATVGTVGSVGALAVCGAGPAGLATIGSFVGGGMAAGAVTVLAAPAIAAGAVGYAVYWFFDDKP